MKKIEFIPMPDFFLVELIKEETKTESGILISTEADPLPCSGIVKAVPLDNDGLICEGDKVYFGKYSGIELSLHIDKYNVLKKSEIFGVEKAK